MHAFKLKTTKYQNRNQHVKWKNVHISLDVMNYSFMIEMRCLYRFSVSALIAMALHTYLDHQNKTTSSKKLPPPLDNYHFSGRLLVFKKIGMSISWKLYWNLPKKLQRIIP